MHLVIKNCYYYNHVISNFNAVESNNALTFDKKAIAKMFKDFFSNLAESLLIKLPNAPRTRIT